MRPSVLAVSMLVAGVVCGGLHCSAEAQGGGTNPPQVSIVVPVVKAGPVVPDGVFSAGEWDGAVSRQLSENIEVCLLADANYLYVGFKLLKEVEADLVSEVYLATGDTEFLNLHSAGALGEAMNAFSPNLHVAAYSFGQNVGWESNVSGKGARSQGKEYKISRAILPDGVRMAGGLIVMGKTTTQRGTFPTEAPPLFSDANAWAKLVLPAK